MVVLINQIRFSCNPKCTSYLYYLYCPLPSESQFMIPLDLGKIKATSAEIHDTVCVFKSGSAALHPWYRSSLNGWVALFKHLRVYQLPSHMQVRGTQGSTGAPLKCSDSPLDTLEQMSLRSFTHKINFFYWSTSDVLRSTSEWDFQAMLHLYLWGCGVVCIG